MELYFKHLTPEAQAQILKEAGINDPKEMNWDVLPITTIEFDNTVSAIYKSTWSDGSVITTPCIVDTTDGEILEIESIDVDPDGSLEEESVIINGEEYPISDGLFGEKIANL